MLLDGPIHRYPGNNHHPRLVCLHGFLGCGEDFRILADQWDEHPALLAPDFPNFASKEPINPLDWSTLLAELHKIIRREIQSCSFDLLGYSMGGRIALHYALEYPDNIRSLTLVGATPGIPNNKEREDRRRSDLGLASKIRLQALDSFLKRWYDQPLLKSHNRIPEPYRSRMKHLRENHQPESIAHVLEHLGTGTMPVAWDRLHEIQIPCLLASGGEDEKFTAIAQKMSERLPTASHYRVPNAGHAACFEEPKDFCKQLERFLQTLPTQP